MTPLQSLDRDRLNQALDAAALAIGLSDPNPRVGCVIGRGADVLGVGSTQQAGGPHAEVVALAAARAAGHDVRGATAWVTLEPCSHHGRTPPCCDALVAAGLSRVVVAIQDPNPRVAGQGMERLRTAGITTEMADADIAHKAREQNVGFFSRHERGRPWVRMKLAVSLDGRMALNDGQSQWITGPQARRDGHAWRRRAGAVVTGAGTVLADDPRLDVRLVDTHLQPLRVVLDSRLRIPATARVLQAPGRSLVFCTQPDRSKAEALAAAGAEIKTVAAAGDGVDPHAVLLELAAREINEVHVEAGQTLSGAFVRAGLVDELLVYVAPVLVGPGLGAVTWSPLSHLAQAPRFRFVDHTAIGPDMRLRALKDGVDAPA